MLKHKFEAPFYFQKMSISTIPIEAYMSRSWLRQHLFYLGFDQIRLLSYQKLSRYIGTNAGGVIKSLVSDVSTFINEELNGNSRNSDAAKKLKTLMYDDVVPKIGGNISECKLFFMVAGYMILNHTERLDDFTDKLIKIYMESKRLEFKSYNNMNDQFTVQVLELINRHYDTCAINYDKLYTTTPKSLSLFITKHIRVELPPLPRIYNKRLLTKSLVHKELYRGFIDPNHPFYSVLLEHDLDPIETRSVIRNDLSFYDGLGDYYLSQESSNLLYHFKHSVPYNHETSFGRKSYTLLKTILATNTLLSRLALAYNLHEGLNDPIVNGLFRDSYVPLVNEWKDLDFDICQESNPFRYEQEFIADYFEQYVGALFLEQPNVAQMWIHEVYENLLFLIGEDHRIPSKSAFQYDYNSWGVDVIGRRLG